MHGTPPNQSFITYVHSTDLIMGYDIRVDIDRKSTGGTFTNYDTIRGTVTLAVTSSIAVNNILVKLEGVSKTELLVPKVSAKRERRNKRDRKDRSERDKRLQDEHKVLYDTMVVFPPDNVRQVSNAKEFTLTPGNYKYPFEFKIPLNNSCVKLLGITNAVLFNSQRFDFSINNGNFNRNTIRNIATLYINNATGAQGPREPQKDQTDYHIVGQLPPSLSGIGDFASIKYFVKVTCKRASLLKMNLRATDPFIFLPLDLDENNQVLDLKQHREDNREVFVRKDIVFKNKVPSVNGVVIPSDKQLPPNPRPRGFFTKLLDPGTNNRTTSLTSRPDNSMDLPFAFEVRFRHPAFLIPTKKPSFKLFLVTSVNPNNFNNAKFGRPDESNGLGVIFMQRLVVELRSITTISVLESDGVSKTIHRSRHDEKIPIANNALHNAKFDFSNATRQKSSSTTSNYGPRELYEIEIPARYYENCILPDRLSPSFTTCNISRHYDMLVVAGFSSERMVDPGNDQEVAAKVRYVDLQCTNMKVLSGIGMANSLLPEDEPLPPKTPRRPEAPPLPDKSQMASQASSQQTPQDPSPRYEQDSSASNAPLPTYDDVMNQGTNGRAPRRQYQQDEQYYVNTDA